jgi:hypothetical protein
MTMEVPLSFVTLARFWGVGEEKFATIRSGGFDEQNATDLCKRIQAGSSKAF